MQPTYVTMTSTGTSVWKVPNWHAEPFQLTFAVISTGGSSYFITVTLEDPTNTYPSPNSSLPTPFTIFTGSSNSMFTLGSTVTAPINSPIAAYQFTLNTISQANARVTLVTIQSGIG